MRIKPGGQPSNQVATIEGTDTLDDCEGVASAFTRLFGADTAAGA